MKIRVGDWLKYTTSQKSNLIIFASKHNLVGYKLWLKQKNKVSDPAQIENPIKKEVLTK